MPCPPLSALFPTGAPTEAELERFLGAALHGAGEWSSPRESDGVLSVDYLEASDAGVSLWGPIYTIDQELHLFWLELQRDPDTGNVRWTLQYDIEASSPRKVRNAFDAGNHPSDLTWLVVLTGHAVHLDGVLLPVLDP